MNRRDFISRLALLGLGLPFWSTLSASPQWLGSLVHLRHATMLLRMGRSTFLVDPMLSAKAGMDPIGNSSNTLRFPLVDLPLRPAALKRTVEDVDAVLLTHTHRDHWDEMARSLIAKDKPIICQPADLDTVRSQGFSQVIAIEDRIKFRGITIYRTTGRHGHGTLAERMGTVSGFVLFKPRKHKVFIAGDTVWCDELKETLLSYRPEYTILNAGGAQFLTGKPITMTPQDIAMVHQTLPESRLIAVHMDTVNHCHITREQLAAAIADQESLRQKLMIPADGDIIWY